MKIALPIIVEGRYDKITLSSIFDAKIIELSGFGIFNSAEKQALIRRLGEQCGVIVLVDSDAGGVQIRSFISSILKKEQVHHVYIPEIAGKEKRKKTPSKQGLLGVEGMNRETLEKLLSRFVSEGTCEENAERFCKKQVTKLDFYSDGLSGGAFSSEYRAALARELSLPRNMSANALLCAINLLFDYNEYKNAVSHISKNCLNN